MHGKKENCSVKFFHCLSDNKLKFIEIIVMVHIWIIYKNDFFYLFSSKLMSLICFVYVDLISTALIQLDI